LSFLLSKRGYCGQHTHATKVIDCQTTTMAREKRLRPTLLSPSAVRIPESIYMPKSAGPDTLVIHLLEFPPVKTATVRTPRHYSLLPNHTPWHVKTSETNTLLSSAVRILCEYMLKSWTRHRCIYPFEFPPVKTATVGAHLTLPRSLIANHTPWHKNVCDQHY
jgi:hypothetical protein